MIAITVLLILILIQMALYVRDVNIIDGLRKELTKTKHVKKMFKESLSSKDDENLELAQENLDLVNMLESAHILLEHTRVSLSDGVFYDKVNDSIVVIDNLEKIGDL